MGKFKDWLKKSKILSNAAKLIPFAGPAIGDSIENMGYGRRRRRRSTRRTTTRRCPLRRRKTNGISLTINCRQVKQRRNARKARKVRTTRRYRFANDGRLIRSAGLGSWIKSGITKVKDFVTSDKFKNGIEKAKEINSALREKKYISNIARKARNVANTLGFDKVADVADKVYNTSSKFGYGKRRVRGGLRYKQNGAGLRKLIARRMPVSNGAGKRRRVRSMPVNNGLTKPCGFNKKGIYNPQLDLENFLAYSVKHK